MKTVSVPANPQAWGTTALRHTAKSTDAIRTNSHGGWSIFPNRIDPCLSGSPTTYVERSILPSFGAIVILSITF